MTSHDLLSHDSFSTPTERMPLLFIGHGNPMNAVEDNAFHRAWQELGRTLPRPKAILSISAHWITTDATLVTAMPQPKTIHDFGGFPRILFEQHYPAPGSPRLAEETKHVVKHPTVGLDHSWGLDHGTWSVVKPMYPEANIPVLQLSIDYGKPMSFHYEIGQQLKALRERGVMIIGSGNIVHNLQRIKFEGGDPYDWAIEFDSKIGDALVRKDDQAILDFQKLGPLAKLAHPTYDHFLPLLYTLGAVDKQDSMSFFTNTFDLASVSMRSVLYR